MMDFFKKIFDVIFGLIVGCVKMSGDVSRFEQEKSGEDVGIACDKNKSSQKCVGIIADKDKSSQNSAGIIADKKFFEQNRIDFVRK